MNQDAQHIVPNGLRMQWVKRPGDPAWPALVALADKVGISAEWCAQKLEAGDEVAIAYVNGEAAGMCWLGSGRLWVDEIHHLVAHNPDECSLYNVFVLPKYRGQRLQQKMTQERMAEAWERGMRRAYTVVKSDNRPSMKNSLRAGFVAVMRVDTLNLGGRPLTILRRLTHRLPAGQLEFAGFPRSPRFHVIRGQLE
jgi:L-amino acid N-acyltransferase YncA